MTPSDRRVATGRPLTDEVLVVGPPHHIDLARGPRRRPLRVIADKAYSHPSTRAALARRGIKVTIPERDDQLARRRARGPGRPYAFDVEIYKRRNVVERCFNRLKQWRGIVTRYDKTARNYRGGVLLASLVLWSRA